MSGRRVAVGCGGLIVAVRDRVSRFLDRECVGLSVSNTAYQPGVYGPPQHLLDCAVFQARFS